MAYAAVFHILGSVLVGLGALTLVPLLVAASEESQRTVVAFAIAAAAAMFTGMLLRLVAGGRDQPLRQRDSFLLAVLLWAVPGVFAGIPFLYARAIPSIADAYFEAVSGLTTTGLTVISDPGQLGHSLVLWRAMTQLMGGLGTIVFALAILPLLGIGGVRVRRPSGAVHLTTASRASMRRSIVNMSLTYFGLVALCGVTLAVAGMPVFDAICYAMSTASTGGFMTDAQGPGMYAGRGVQVILAVFMIAAAINFYVHVRAMQGTWSAYVGDPEFRLLFVLLVAAGLWSVLSMSLGDTSVARSNWSGAFFNAISALTTTGYFVEGPSTTFSAFVALGLAVIGGSSASTAGGLKLMRVIMLLRQSMREMALLLHAHAVVPVKYGDASVPTRMIHAVWGLFVAYIFCLICIASGLASTGLSFEHALTYATSALTNTGPVLAAAGGASLGMEFAPLAKLFLIIGMIAGRLELFALLVLFTPMFWQE